MRSISVLAALVALPAVALAAEMHMGAADSEAGKALMAANDLMMKEMSIALSGDPDKDFVMMMIPHHRGAIEMAKVEIQFGKDPEIRKLAEAIIVAQEKIAGMETWLAAHAN